MCQKFLKIMEIVSSIIYNLQTRVSTPDCSRISNNSRVTLCKRYGQNAKPLLLPARDFFILNAKSTQALYVLCSRTNTKEPRQNVQTSFN